MRCARTFLMFRAILWSWLLLGIGHAEPVPDFAINVAISGSATVSSLALETKVLFQSISSSTLQLKSGYNRLAAVTTALEQISSKIVTAGTALTQAISTMSLNNNGPIATYFNDISTALSTLQGLVGNGLSSQMATLNQNIDNFVTAKLQDSFRSMSTSLGLLSQAVAAMRTAVTSAKNASGSSPTVSPTTAKKYVTARIITDLTNAIRLLKSDIPIMVLVVHATLGSFQDADVYLTGITGEAELRVQDIVGYGSDFETDVNAFAGALKTNTRTELDTPYQALKLDYANELKATVEADTDFKSAIDGLFTKLDTLLADGATISSTFDSTVNAYLAHVLALDDDLTTFYGTSMCSVIKMVVQVVIKNGPYAQFCFSKFAQKVFNLFVTHTYDAADCYRLQVYRLEQLRTAIHSIVQLILHDIEELLENVQQCVRLNDYPHCVPFFIKRASRTINVNMKLYALILLVVLATESVVVNGLPRPDFGIPQGALTNLAIAQRATGLRGTFDTLDDFTIKPGTDPLAVDSINSIGLQVSRAGITLMDAIVALANDDVGPIADGFARVNQALTVLNQLLNGGLTSELNTLSDKIDPLIRSIFTEGFASVSKALQKLSTALAALQFAIQRAKTAAGSGPVTATLVKRYVTSQVLYGVDIALLDMISTVPLIKYGIYRTDAAGRPDFGLQGEIVGSPLVIQQTSTASFNIEALSDYKILLGSEYQPLYDERDAFYSVAQKLTRAGIAMADSVVALADDNSSIVTPPFLSAIASVNSMQAVIGTGLAQEFLALRPRNKPYITDRLTDTTTYIGQTLTALAGILRTLQPAVEQTQANAGGSGRPVTTTAARQGVSPRLINSLLNTIDRLGGGISPLIYSVHNPLSQVDQGDTYISTAKSDIEAALLQAHQEVVDFNGNLRQLKQETIDYTNTVGSSYVDQQTQLADILPTLKASSTYQGLKTALDAYDSALSVRSINAKTLQLEQTVTGYVALSKTFDDDLVIWYGDRICPVLRGLVQVLVASGPYASYCFHKYSLDVTDLAVHNFYDIGECYALELNRLYATHRLIADIADLVIYNFVDLFDNLNICAQITPCPSGCDSCVTTIGKFLATMAQLTDGKFGLITQIITYEAKASLQRVKSCTAFSKYRLVADAHDLLKDVFTCEETGYKNPN
uniref:Secreted protein n=1 Tax=Anopheles dirus TaxID=7168 RepID=A0A182NUG1_9DIPT